MKIKSSDGRVLKVSPQDERAVRAMIESGNHEGVDAYFKKAESESFKKGGMLKRKDGSYSRRGLWDNIRANRGSGKKPTKEMLKQEAKIRAKHAAGGTVFKGYVTEQPMGDAVPWHTSTIGETMGKGGYTVKRSSARKGKTHVVIGPDGTKKYFGDSKLGQHPGNPKRKKAFYARHAKNLKGNPYFRAFARATWADGGKLTDNMYDLGIMPYDFGGPLHHNPSVYGISPSHSTAMRIGYETDLNPDGTIHTPYGFETAAYNERMGLGGLFGKAKEGVGNFFDRNGKDFLKNVGTNAIDDLRDTGAIAYGVGEGFLDTATFGATDSLTDAGYKGLQKIGGTKAEDIKHQDKLHGIGTIGGAGLGAAFTGNIAGAAQQGLKGGNQWLQNSNASAGLKQNLGAGLQLGQTAAGFLGGGAGSLGNINNASAMANFANTGMGQFSNNAAQIGNMFNMGQQFGLPLNSMISRHGGYVHMADGGQTGLVPINVEGANFSEGYGPDAKKGELLVLNGKVIKNYVGRPPHPAEGQNPMGNDDAPEGLIVIPKARTKEYLEAGLEKRKQIERSLVSQQQDREMKKSNMMADGGKTKKSGNANRWNAYNDPYTVIAMPDRNSSFAEDSVRVFPGQRLFGKTPYMRDLGNQMGVITTEWNPYYELPKEARMYQDSTYMYANPEFLPRRKKGDGGYYSFGMGDQGMGYGGPIGNPETINDITYGTMKKGGWIQKATASIKRRGTEGVCTGSKFGSSSCPPGSRRYNLAKTFRAMAKHRKHEDGGFVDPVTGSHTVMYGQGGQLPEGLLRTRMRASGASPEEINSYVAERYEMGGATNVTHDFPIRRLKYQNAGEVLLPPYADEYVPDVISPRQQAIENYINSGKYINTGTSNDKVFMQDNNQMNSNYISTPTFTQTPTILNSQSSSNSYSINPNLPGNPYNAMMGRIASPRMANYTTAMDQASSDEFNARPIGDTSSYNPYISRMGNSAGMSLAGANRNPYSMGALRGIPEGNMSERYMANVDKDLRTSFPDLYNSKSYQHSTPSKNTPSSYDYSNIGMDVAGMAPMLYNLGRGIFEKPVNMNAADYMTPEMQFRATRFDETPYDQAASRAQYALRQMGSGPGYRAALGNITAQAAQARSQGYMDWMNKEALRRQGVDEANLGIAARNKAMQLQTDIMNQQNKAARKDFFAKSAEQFSQAFNRDPMYFRALAGQAPRQPFTGWKKQQ